MSLAPDDARVPPQLSEWLAGREGSNDTGSVFTTC